MADPETPPVVTPPAAAQGLSETELKTLVSTTLDEKLGALAFAKPEDLETFKTSILTDVTALFESHKTTPLDEAGFLTKVDGLLNDKLSKIGVPVGRKPGPLSRFIFGN